MMWSQFFVCALVLVVIQGSNVKADLADEFLAAIPIHPTFRTPDIIVQEEDEIKIQSLTEFKEPFNPFADCAVNRTDLQIGDYGTITTPNYPKHYPGRTSCQWYLESPPNTRIEATIFDLYTQPWFFGYFDYVMISKDGNFSKVDRMAGDMNTKTPLTIISEANKFGVRFRSSNLFNFRGLKIHYIVKKEDDNAETRNPSPYDNVCGQSTLLGNSEVMIPTIPSFPPSVTVPSLPALVPSTTVAPENENGTSPASDVPDESDEYIIGPDFASRGSFPWMAALLIDGRSFCGGSLIDDMHILTAAHCTDGAKKITVLLGALNIKAKKEQEPERIVFNVTRENIFQHPDYNPNTILYDITIIRLPQKVQFNENIRPICLPNQYYTGKTFVNDEVRVSGWGKPLDKAPGISPVLKNTTVTVMSNGNCRSFFRSIVTGNLICVATKIDASPCRGDSGGPLIVKETDHLGRPYFMQVGIVSFGGNSCQRGFPVGFTRVTAFLDYISLITKKQ